jgi:hypothetical protein
MTAALVVIAVAQLYVAVSPCHRAAAHASALASLLMAELILSILCFMLGKVLISHLQRAECSNVIHTSYSSAVTASEQIE